MAKNTMYENRLKAWLNDQGASAEHFSFPGSCHSVAEAAAQAKVSPDQFVKNICMITQSGEFVVAIVQGHTRASTDRVRKALGISERPRQASDNEILENTGYPCGGTPSFGFTEHVSVLIDDSLGGETCDRTRAILTGGGSDGSLIRTTVDEILRLNQGHIRVARVRK